MKIMAGLIRRGRLAEEVIKIMKDEESPKSVMENKDST
jgi:hypothetical protein